MIAYVASAANRIESPVMRPVNCFARCVQRGWIRLLRLLEIIIIPRIQTVRGY